MPEPQRPQTGRPPQGDKAAGAAERIKRGLPGTFTTQHGSAVQK